MGQQVVWKIEDSGELEANGTEFFPIQGQLQGKQCLVPFDVTVDHESHRGLKVVVDIEE